jgi:hypothetical protein
VFRKLCLAALASLIALAAAASEGLMTDEIVIQYPDSYVKVLAADLAKMSADDGLRSGVIGPLAAANHPLNGILRSLGVLELDVADVVYAAYGTGSGMTPTSLVSGVDTVAAMEAASALEAEAADPESSYANWSLETIGDTPVVLTGGRFGPFEMQWSYFADQGAFWIGSEIGLIGPPDPDRLRASAESILCGAAGTAPIFPELCISLGVRGGDLAFVRVTDSAVDRPSEAGEEAMGYAVRFGDDSAIVSFIVRFASVARAAAAASKISAGTSAYLAQDLYIGELIKLTPAGNTLLFDVSTDLSGIVGLLMLTVPIL